MSDKPNEPTLDERLAAIKGRCGGGLTWRTVR